MQLSVLFTNPFMIPSDLPFPVSTVAVSNHITFFRPSFSPIHTTSIYANYFNSCAIEDKVPQRFFLLSSKFTYSFTCLYLILFQGQSIPLILSSLHHPVTLSLLQNLDPSIVKSLYFSTYSPLLAAFFQPTKKFKLACSPGSNS